MKETIILNWKLSLLTYSVNFLCALGRTVPGIVRGLHLNPGSTAFDLCNLGWNKLLKTSRRSKQTSKYVDLGKKDRKWEGSEGCCLIWSGQGRPLRSSLKEEKVSHEDIWGKTCRLSGLTQTYWNRLHILTELLGASWAHWSWRSTPLEEKWLGAGGRNGNTW